MSRRTNSVRAAALISAVGALMIGLSVAASASPTSTVHEPVLMYNIPTTAAIGGTTGAIGPSIQPPPVLACLPVSITLPVTPPSPIPGSVQCVPPPPPAGEPWPANMAYFGGHVQLNPKIYLVYWGWDTPGAWSARCNASGSNGRLPGCDPDGVAGQMSNFVNQLGGSAFAGVSTQYYQSNADGSQSFVKNPAHQLAGVWVDNSSHLTWNPSDTGATLQHEVFAALGKEASLAAAHFGLTRRALLDADIVIAQPQHWSDPVATSLGYCAWHDYTEPNVEGGVYNGDTVGISFTNMPYVLNQGSSCGQGLEGGKLDGVTIVLGHELEETVTDPGAEDVINGKNLGGWYDSTQYEIGDKCAWVGVNAVNLLTGAGPALIPGVPGEVGTTKGNRGTVFPVQSLWSNQAASGVGYCAGAGTDLPTG